MASAEPSLTEQPRRIVQFRIDSGLTSSPSELTRNLVGSLVDLGVIPGSEAEVLVSGVLEQVFLPVTIDIKPGSFPNSINPKSKGSIPVAVLSTASFNAPASVDMTALTFGRTGNEMSLLRSSLEDVNGDGHLDIVCHFDTQRTGFQPGDTLGVLKGRTLDGIQIRGQTQFTSSQNDDPDKRALTELFLVLF